MPIVPFTGEYRMPGDKSISHRALMLAALCQGQSRITGLSDNADVTATRDCLRQLGIPIDVQADGSVLVEGRHGWPGSKEPLDCRNAGTAMRLLAGILCAQPFRSVLTGDASLSRRPMRRIIDPLCRMGGRIRSETGTAPLLVEPAPQEGLQAIRYELPMASAQVKSALLLAGLFAHGELALKEPSPSRDHTERMLRYLGVEIAERNGWLLQPGGQVVRLDAAPFNVPGDPSSAAFFIVAALCTPGSQIAIRDINLNPGRIGLITALQRINGDIRIENQRLVCGEPVGDIIVTASALKGDLVVAGDLIPALIDELPILAAAGVFLEGRLLVKDAEELRHKESDRIAAIADELGKLGVAVETTPDGFIIEGPWHERLHAPTQPLDAHHDHRIAMTLLVLNRLLDEAPWPLHGLEWTEVSFPGFRDRLYGNVVEVAR